MAVFDADAQRVVVRIVYDGPANSGKTTNLAQLCRFFTTLRRSELIAFEERAGRTLFFDWLHLDGGLVGGHPLRCQLVTVPGQAVLSHRRRHLLKKADAVVFVCESTPASMDIGRRMIEGLLKDGAGRLPLVVQANKQDLPGCLGVEEVTAALGLGPAISVVPARAHEGAGVRETLVLAIRAAANIAQCRILEAGIRALGGDAETAESLYRALAAETAPPEASAVTAVLASLGRVPLETEPAPVRSTPKAQPTPNTDPPLPGPGGPIGYVWPPAAGREILRDVAGQPALPRPDLVGRHGTSDGSGASDTVIVQAGPWCLKTSRRRHFPDADAGRSAMLQLARRKTVLGPLMPQRTVLCLQPDAAGGAWLWTVTPWLTTLRAWMTRAVTAADESVLGAALAAFADAAAEALRATVRSGIVLDVHPSNFALTDGRLAYLDDDIASGDRVPSIGHALLRRIDEYAAWPAAVGAYTAALCSSLPGHLSAEEISRLRIDEGLAQALVQTAAARDARDRLRGALARTSKPPV